MIDFPSSPQPGDTYSSGGTVWTWDGTAWVGSTAPTTSSIANLDDLADVSAAGRIAGDYLYFDGTYWIPGEPPAPGLDDLTDVAIANAASGDVLYRTVDGWQNQPLLLNHLANVEGEAVYGQVLAYNGGTWSPRDPNLLRPAPSTYLELGNATYTVNRNWASCLVVLTNSGGKTITLPNDGTIPVGMMFWMSPLNAAATLTGGSGVTISGSSVVAPSETALIWKRAATAWNSSANGTQAATSARFYALVGDGINNAFTIHHNLGTRDVMVGVYQNDDTYEEIVFDVFHSSANEIVVQFSSVPPLNSYRVVIAS